MRIDKESLNRATKSSARTGVWRPNRYNILVKACCMTCKYGETEGQLCTCYKKNSRLYGEQMEKHDICEEYKIKSALNLAGKGDGRVKKRAYLMAVLNNDPIAAEFRRKGNIYEDF